MTRASDHNTYAVSLYPDEPSSSQIISCVKSLAEVCGNDTLIKNAVPSHITLGMFHAKEEDLPRVAQLFNDFSAPLRSFEISLCGADCFCDKVIFLSVKKSPSLLNLNKNLHEKLLPFFEPGGNRNYLPERWQPHIALALKLNKTEFEKALSAAKSLSLPETAKICSVALAQCHPYKEILRLNLKTDTLTSAQRHKNMAAIRSTGGALEKELRSQLFKFGFRFRKNDKRLSGSPDIVFPHYHAVVFINGCFWHAHGWNTNTERCDKFRFPKSNQDFWLKKFTRNKERDQKDIKSLTEQGWRVAVVWECSITGRGRAQKIRTVAEKLSYWIEEDFGTQIVVI